MHRQRDAVSPSHVIVQGFREVLRLVIRDVPGFAQFSGQCRIFLQ